MPRPCRAPWPVGVAEALARLGGPPTALPADWPYRQASHTVRAAGQDWHLQILGQPLGQAPTMLLLHGTGASTHSWRALMPQLMPHFCLLLPDLPGHGASARPAQDQGLSLPGMALGLAALLKVLRLSPDVIVGHSAGAAVAARLCLDGGAAPQTLISINGAWYPPQGVTGWLYSPMARLMDLNPLAPALFSWRAAKLPLMRRLVEGTGSRLDDEGLHWYQRLAANPRHVGAVLTMMAQWDLLPLLQDLPALEPALQLVVAEGDLAVAPAQAQRLLSLVPGASLHRVGGGGHLLHEESPTAIAALLGALAGRPVPR